MTKSAWIAKIGWAFAARRGKKYILGGRFTEFSSACSFFRYAQPAVLPTTSEAQCLKEVKTSPKICTLLYTGRCVSKVGARSHAGRNGEMCIRPMRAPRDGGWRAALSLGGGRQSQSLFTALGCKVDAVGLEDRDACTAAMIGAVACLKPYRTVTATCE